MKNIFIEYPKCSTCKKAKKWLEENNLEPDIVLLDVIMPRLDGLGVLERLEENNIEFIDRNIVEETPTVEELTDWIQKSGEELKKWFNTSGLKYKKMKLKDKLVTMSDKEKIGLLASDGMLIKRPVLVSDKGIFTGFKEDKWKILK